VSVDADHILTTHLKAKLGVYVSNHLPSHVTTQMPYVRVATLPGVAIHPTLGIRASIDIDCWDSTRAAAFSLAQAANDVLVAAWRRQTPLNGGVIARMPTIGHPAEFRTVDQLSRVYRYQATHNLIIRITT
jgi:hypothetical protein